MAQLDHEFCEESFNGISRLFPLPGLVVYPQVIQALHIFEPRYREMLDDAVRKDGLISMGVLAPGWQDDYEGTPPIEPEVCLGKVVSRTRLPDGCSNILLLGLRRARVLEELPSDRLFRRVRIELLEDQYCSASEDQRAQLQLRLLRAFQRRMPKSAMIADQLTQVLGTTVSLAMLTDLIAYSLDVSVNQKLHLLAETRVELRADYLLCQLERNESESELGDDSPSNSFPPDFSVN